MKFCFITKLIVYSIPSPQTILVMHDKLTMAMLLGQDFDSINFLTWESQNDQLTHIKVLKYRLYMTKNMFGVPYMWYNHKTTSPSLWTMSLTGTLLNEGEQGSIQLHQACWLIADVIQGCSKCYGTKVCLLLLRLFLANQVLRHLICNIPM